MTQACIENDCALIGGEMAEMPGIYHKDDFDLVGTIVGVVERHLILPGNRVREHDVLIGIPSTGLHTNGYSLARAIVFDKLGLAVDAYVPELQCTVAEALLSIHKSYLQELKPFLEDEALHGLAHITGGGIPKPQTHHPRRTLCLCELPRQRDSASLPVAASFRRHQR